ncbi:5'/3'-nucleotidase SurE [Neptunomonas japonica]|uniref:5'-nucleotidase SurE n=1 Tax=Neptunomonas japonica JAMM 1380 TaxID=1441457 RepID=A0A7R6PG46_9GAMM|nr:5'/3'-nucleotidase SurE [Neptunomonas japonica]BBB28551.1 5'-nucleotidase [Neptunomonas japonica JAMM 1380]
MKILISNDDGVFSPGLEALALALSEVAEIQVVAPDRNRSGASNALTLTRPVDAHRHENNGFVSLNGTPTDCVHMGVSGLFGMEPDIVVSGINSGANLGDDVIYSGTVAAAMEGRALSLPPVAISLASHNPQHFSTAAEIAKSIVQRISQLALPARTVLNINVPDLPLSEIKGVHITRLGHRAAAGKPEAVADPRGKIRYWVAGAGDAVDKEPGTDFYAIEHGFVSITPLHIDMTLYSGMDDLGEWLEGLL